MSKASGTSFPHNTLWRKFRRRCPTDALTLLMVLPASAPTLCILAWLSRVPILRLLAYLMACLWLLFSVLMVGSSMFALRVRKGNTQPPTQPVSALKILIFPIGSVLTVLCLLLGRLDAAVYVYFGIVPLLNLTAYRKFSLSVVPNLLLTVFLLIAYTLHLVWIVAALLVFQVIWTFLSFAKPSFGQSLREVVEKKPTRREYVARTREQCAAGGG